jgi:hypothetical protein
MAQAMKWIQRLENGGIAESGGGSWYRSEVGRMGSSKKKKSCEMACDGQQGEFELCIGSILIGGCSEGRVGQPFSPDSPCSTISFVGCTDARDEIWSETSCRWLASW